ncbi:MAG: hypothetical protein WBX25_10250 [Rhodomicrobium sp.]
MKYVIVALLLLFTGTAEAQRYERKEGHGWRHREREESREWRRGEREEGPRWRHRERVKCHCWRDRDMDEGPRWVWRLVREDGEGWRRPRRHRVRHYRENLRRAERFEGRDWRPERYERRDWRPERYEGRDWRPEKHEGRDFDKYAGRRCRPPLHAAGDADARLEKARGFAIKSWQEQVINEYGERYINFEAAYVLDEHCDPARVGEGGIIDLKRCVITAAPCLTPRAEGLREEAPREGERRREEEHR